MKQPEVRVVRRWDDHNANYEYVVQQVTWSIGSFKWWKAVCRSATEGVAVHHAQTILEEETKKWHAKKAGASRPTVVWQEPPEEKHYR